MRIIHPILMELDQEADTTRVVHERPSVYFRELNTVPAPYGRSAEENSLR